MKRKLLKLTAFLLVLSGVASSCNPECPPDCSDEYPKDISFTEYSLLETSCQWQNLPYEEEVIIISSNEELKKYISCTSSNYPAINFSTHTLLLTSGKTNHGICKITAKSLQQLSANKFELNIEITLNDVVDIEEWAAAFIVEKLEKTNNVELKVTTEVIETKIILPVVVTDQKIIDFFYESGFTGNSRDSEPRCFFTTLDLHEDTCLMINTMDEFRSIYKCTGDLPEIDFNIYTLVIGKKKVNNLGYYISAQKVITDCALTLYLELDKEEIISPSVGLICYWGIYPKLPNKPVFVELKFNWL